MKELGAVTRQMIESARVGLGPDDLAVARMRARVGMMIGAAAVTGATEAAAAVGSSTGSAVVTGAASGKLLALAVAAMVATGAVGTAVAVAIVRSHAEPPAHVAPSAAPHAIVTPQSAPPASAPAPAHELAPAGSIDHAPVPRLHRAIVAAAPAPHVTTLARELVLIDDASSALRAGRPTDALAGIASYHRETGRSGQLAQDAAAIELEALCELHDPTAPAKLADFTGRWPHARIAAACTAAP